MENLHYPATHSTPRVKTSWDAGLLEMRGDSFPENSFAFFAPLLDWLTAYLDAGDAPLRVELHLLYLNTSSVKVMMDIFDLLEEAYTGGRSVAVNWHYDIENERIAELAEEFREDYTFPFGIVPDQDPGAAR